MPRDGSNIYSQPFPDVVEDTTIESTVYNGFTNDIAADLNAARPIVAGGTGATNADQALFNLAAEKATQIVTNYDSHLWVPGSFRSAAGATGAPTVNAFAGTAIIGEALANPPTNQNVVLEARDLGDASVPGLKYIREKTAGVWSAWALDVGSQAIRYDADQNLTEVQKAQGRENIYAAPFDALAYNGMQINGSMEVSQERGTSLTTTSASYICDGWRLYVSGTTMAVSAGMSTVGGPAGYNGLISITVTAPQVSIGSGDLAFIVQQLEGYRISRLAFGSASAQSITLGFWVAHHRTGTYSGSIRNISARSCAFTYTQNVADTWEYKTVTLPGDTAGTWATDNAAGLSISFTLAAGSTLTAVAANVWAAGNFIAAPGQVNAVASTFDAFRITGVVVLPGIEAPSAARSPLIMRPFDQELLTCQRYYRWIPFNLHFTAAGAGSVAGHSVYFPTMRANPAISGVAADPNTTQFVINSSGSGFAGITLYSAMATGTAAGAGAYQVTGYRASADARL